MIYSKEKKFLFIHVPKTAGTSIKATLQPFGGKPGVANYLARRLEPYPSLCYKTGLTSLRTYDSHTTYQKIARIIPAAELASLFIFAFVRNPFDRLYSFYLHILAHPEHAWYPKINNYGSFSEMLKNLDEVGEPSQKSYLINEQGKIMVDYIGRLEHIETDFKNICEKIGVPYHLPNKNARKHNDWREAYSGNERELVYDYYKEDFEEFNYSREEVGKKKIIS